MAASSGVGAAASGGQLATAALAVVFVASGAARQVALCCTLMLEGSLLQWPKLADALLHWCALMPHAILGGGQVHVGMSSVSHPARCHPPTFTFTPQILATVWQQALAQRLAMGCSARDAHCIGAIKEQGCHAVFPMPMSLAMNLQQCTPVQC
jgi:hypothetical protein